MMAQAKKSVRFSSYSPLIVLKDTRRIDLTREGSLVVAKDVYFTTFGGVRHGWDLAFATSIPQNRPNPSDPTLYELPLVSVASDDEAIAHFRNQLFKSQLGQANRILYKLPDRAQPKLFEISRDDPNQFGDIEGYHYCHMPVVMAKLNSTEQDRLLGLLSRFPPIHQFVLMYS